MGKQGASAQLGQGSGAHTSPRREHRGLRPARGRGLVQGAQGAEASSGVRAGGASPGLGLTWTSPPAKPQTPLCQA